MIRRVAEIIPSGSQLLGYPTWWRHQMETFSALLAICAGNSPVTGEFPAQRPVTRSFGVFFDLRLNKRLRKQSWFWRFETPSRPLWHHCNVGVDHQTWQRKKSGHQQSRYWPRSPGIFRFQHHKVLYHCTRRTTDICPTSNGSWCIGIKGEMSGTVCVTFTWDIYIYMSCL